MAPSRRDPTSLSVGLASLAGAAALAVALADIPRDWRRAGLLVVGALGCAAWGRGLLRRRADLVAQGVVAIGLEAIVALAALKHAGAGVALVGPALLLAAEAGFLAIELRPELAGGPAALDRGLRVGAIALAGCLVGALVLGSGVTAPDAVLDAAAVIAVLALTGGLAWALRRSD
jgi:hypothetical protein